MQKRLERELLCGIVVMQRSSFNVCVIHSVAVVSPEVFQRLEETFRRNSSGSYLVKSTFTREILGENVPDKLSDVSCCVVKVEWPG